MTARRPKKMLVADLFCGAGGSSTGAHQALADLGLGMELVCVNHWATAIATHRANHPAARHYCQDIAVVRPHLVVPEGRLDLLMASPTCTHHSVARGGKPTSDQQRADPWHVVTWLTELRVARLLVENVPEFVNWGPVEARTGKPIAARRGEYFHAWVDTIRRLGFTVDWRVLNAADYGEATTRRRLFIQARAGGKPIAWPRPSHAKPQTGALAFPGLAPWRPARDIIDWSIPGRSIFARKKPLSAKTLARIYTGAAKFGWPQPFLVILRNHMAAQGIGAPIPTVAAVTPPSLGSAAPGAAANGNHIGLARPVIVNGRKNATARPVPTLDTKGGVWLAEPFIATVAHGNDSSERAPNNRRSKSVNGPLGTVTAGGISHALLAPTICATGRVQLAEGVAEAGDDAGAPGAPDQYEGGSAAGPRYDILFRMLEPHELAAAMGFDDYSFTGTKTEQVKQIGNAVPVRLVRALVRAAMADAADAPRRTAQGKQRGAAS